MTGQASAVICNPVKVADATRLRAGVEAQLDAAGWSAPAWHETTAEDPGYRQAREAVDAGAEVVFACGGDGTVQACATALAGSRAALAIVPAGTGNLLARHLGLPTDPTEAVQVATRGRRRRIDVGRVGDQCFTVAAGIGFDADLLSDAPGRLKHTMGWPAYVVSALRHLGDRRFRVEVRLDDRPPWRRRVRSVVVANVSELRGGLVIAPDASDDDGRLDVVVITARSIRDWLTIVYRVLRRRPHHRVLTYTATDIDLRVRHRPVARQLDGDPLPAGEGLHVQVDPAALQVCVP